MDITRRRDAVTEKKHRMERALGMLKSMDEISYMKAVAILSFNLGLSEPKAKEYIRTFRELGHLNIKDGMIRTYTEKEILEESEKIEKMIE